MYNHKEYIKKWRKKNYAKIIKQSAEYYQNNKEHLLKKMKEYSLRKPWVKICLSISGRCSHNGIYYKKGIRNLLTIDDLEYLWKRDRANSMKRPSIHRFNSKKDYVVDNCEIIEWGKHLKINAKNLGHPINQYTVEGKFIKRFDSISAARAVGGGESTIREALFNKKKWGIRKGYRWKLAVEVKK